MKKSRSSLFLMELIIVIFFLSITSAVCLQVFAKASVMGKTTVGINKAVLWAENMGEIFYEYGEDFEAHKDEVLSECFSDEDAEEYFVDIKYSQDENFLYLDYSCKYLPLDKELYSISFIQNRREVLK